MAVLTDDIDATQKVIPTDAGIGYYQVGSELVRVLEIVAPAVAFSDPPTGLRVVERGVGGSTKASHSSGATLTRYYPEAPAGESEGGGLPSQWTDGGHGDVTATTDDGSVPLTVTGAATINPRATDLYGILIEAATGFYNAYNAFIRVIDENGVQIFNVDAGGFDMRAPAGQPETHVLFNETDTSYASSLSSRELLLSQSSGANAFQIGQSYGLRMGAFVPDFTSGASTIQLYYDDTDGAAKLKIKGKSADGTVVTGSVNLT